MAARTSTVFPRPTRSSPEVVAYGGRADPESLKAAYLQGIFPWPHEGWPLLWFCPDPRFVLVPEAAHLSRSLRKRMRQGAFEVRADTACPEVIRRCSGQPRPGQAGTWITPGMVAGYSALHEEGLVHSIEAWADGQLVGGLYGVSLGGVFFGESMFADAPDASKVCLATLVGNLLRWGFPLIDCQSHTEHLASFGAVHWPREIFLARLRRALRMPTRAGRWTLEADPAEVAAGWRDRG
ncbi:MAG: leucyl/phenylalanyl-tRNA--protein transferase [Acidobacteriota bacterium]|nr:leucyl/phenylalanyl-tRNA--protein transferase [Acidobacteriota bacterium]